MSNVLIGIIGVILFIGLALAGALILGDDFRSSKNETAAAAGIQTIAQIAAAANMRNLKLGAPVPAGAASQLVPRFLKTVPNNPTGGFLPDLHSAASDYNGPAVFSVMEIRNAEACLTINRQLGVADTVPTLNDYPSWNAGCYRQGQARGNNATGTYVGYSRI